MTSLFARNERLLWRTRFSTTEMPSQFLTQYNTIKSWQFSLFSLKLSLQSTHVHVVHWNGGRAVCRLHGHRAVSRLREVSRLRRTYIYIYMYIYTYKRVVCVCLLVVGLLFIGHTTFVHFAALPPSGRESRSRRGRPRARGQACTVPRARERMPYNFSRKKSLHWCLSKTKLYARACCRILTAEIFKKREKENQHATSQVHFTVCLLLECLLFESYWIVFFTNRVRWSTKNTNCQSWLFM